MKRAVRNVGLMLCAGMVTMLITATTQAQINSRVGIKGGLNLSNLYATNVEDENARISWHGGLYAQLFSSEFFSIQPEINYSLKGTGLTYGNDLNNLHHKTKINLAYLDIPVLAVFKLGTAAEIHAGPYWSYLLKAEIRNNEGDPDNEFDTIDRNNFDDWDYGLIGGIGFNVGKGGQIGVRYNYGLNPIANSSYGKSRLGNNTKNQVAQLYVAFNLNASAETDNDY